MRSKFILKYLIENLQVLIFIFDFENKIVLTNLFQFTMVPQSLFQLKIV